MCDFCGEEKETREHSVAYYGDDGWWERVEQLCEDCHAWYYKLDYFIDEEW